jgi:VCBS repeat-containing protein
LSGTYGNLIVQSDGSYSYTANDTAKNAGETVYDFFAFTVSDGTYTDDATLILEIN